MRDLGAIGQRGKIIKFEEQCSIRTCQYRRKVARQSAIKTLPPFLKACAISEIGSRETPGSWKVIGGVFTGIKEVKSMQRLVTIEAFSTIIPGKICDAINVWRDLHPLRRNLYQGLDLHQRRKCGINN